MLFLYNFERFAVVLDTVNSTEWCCFDVYPNTIPSVICCPFARIACRREGVESTEIADYLRVVEPRKVVRLKSALLEIDLSWWRNEIFWWICNRFGSECVCVNVCFEFVLWELEWKKPPGDGYRTHFIFFYFFVRRMSTRSRSLILLGVSEPTTIP